MQGSFSQLCDKYGSFEGQRQGKKLRVKVTYMPLKHGKASRSLAYPKKLDSSLRQLSDRRTTNLQEEKKELRLVQVAVAAKLGADLPSPLAATSVASMMGFLLDLNSCHRLHVLNGQGSRLMSHMLVQSHAQGERARTICRPYCKHPVPLLLQLIAMDGEGRPPLLAQLACHVIAPSLGLAEHQDPAAVHVLLQEARQGLVLLTLCHKLEALLNHVVCMQLQRADCYLQGIAVWHESILYSSLSLLHIMSGNMTLGETW